MDSRRSRLIRVVTVIGIALGAGHVAQRGNPQTSFAAAAQGSVPVDVVNLAARSDAAIARTEPGLPDADVPMLPNDAVNPVRSTPAMLDAPREADHEARLDCASRLGLAARPGAMIDVLLMSPCRRNERVVLRHAGVAVTYRTNGAGALFASIPALSTDAQVSALFSGGETVWADLAVPDAAAHRRFGVQWLGASAFQVNAFENDADYGAVGHVSAARPGQPAGTVTSNGFLTLLGDDAVDMPMLAEIYTFPAGRADVPVTVEAAVTKATCGHEILGETLSVASGVVRVADLSVTMPGCDAVGDTLVLKNLAPDTKLAAAD